jgi:23S rRNA A2030 N6-methylase RlmJ
VAQALLPVSFLGLQAPSPATQAANKLRNNVNITSSRKDKNRRLFPADLEAKVVDWKALDDPQNIENNNAGNGGDLVKHTVYLATLQFLLQQPLWSEGLRLRECHAGRGVYRISDKSGRRTGMAALFSAPAKGMSILLYNAQREVLGRLGCWPDPGALIQWYAGSAATNALALGNNNQKLHQFEAYEAEPATRHILRIILMDPKLSTPKQTRVLPLAEHDKVFDGEAYVAENIGGWNKQDLILLDPFAMWRQRSHQEKRNQYKAIINALIRRKNDAPLCIIFWTWGRHFPIAMGDLKGISKPVLGGYQDLRGTLHAEGRRFILVEWRWGLQFAMWIIAPTAQLSPLHHEISFHCRMLTDHLARHGYHPTKPKVNVSID